MSAYHTGSPVVLLVALFQVAAAGPLAYGRTACDHHGSEAEQGHVSGDHDGAAGEPGADQGEHAQDGTPCTCAGVCHVGGEAPPAPSSDLAVMAVRAPVRQAAEATERADSEPLFLLPFATAPPLLG